MRPNTQTLSLVAIVGLLLGAPLRAGADSESDADGNRNAAPNRPEAGKAGSKREESPVRVVKIGAVFVEGQYLAPPYRLRQDGDKILINDRVVAEVPQSQGRWGRRWGGGGRGGRWGNRRPAFRGRWVHWYAERLENANALLFFREARPVVIDRIELFRVLLSPKPRDLAVDDLVDQLPRRFIPTPAREWILEFEPKAEVAESMQAAVREYDEAIEQHRNRHGRVSSPTLDAIAYPLTILGMLLAAAAVWHLLQGRLKAETGDDETALSPKAVRSAVVCIALIVALSALDLTWTILATQAGQMKELNPLGSRLIENPLALTAFKAAFTFLGAGLLFALRRYSVARRASWWMCLVLTIVTFRWLIFNSMMVS